MIFYLPNINKEYNALTPSFHVIFFPSSNFLGLKEIGISFIGYFDFKIITIKIFIKYFHI